MSKIFHFWAKKPEDNSCVEEYVFQKQGNHKNQGNVISLGFLQTYTTDRGKGYGPVCSIFFTEDQLVQFIIEAEKALQSIQGQDR